MCKLLPAYRGVKTMYFMAEVSQCQSCLLVGPSLIKTPSYIILLHSPFSGRYMWLPLALAVETLAVNRHGHCGGRELNTLLNKVLPGLLTG